MNYIFEALATKPHNGHHLNRYIRFIISCINKNENQQYVEFHHICPKSKDLFPELKNDKNNIIKLTYRQHVIAHKMLFKSYNTDSMAASLLFTLNQYNVNECIRHTNSRIIVNAKQKLSDSRKGKTPHHFTKECRKKLSNSKKEYYSHVENRQKQSEACKGSKKKHVAKMKAAALNRSETHKENLKQSISSAWQAKIKSGYNVIPKRLYVTPFGVFTNVPKYRVYCINPDKPISIHSIKGDNPAFPASCVGRTPRELGFYTIKKTNHEFEQFCESLNQVHQLEPSHALLSLLGDFPLLEKILLQQ